MKKFAIKIIINGILVAPLLIWLVREPARGAMDTHKPADEAVPFSQSLATFIRRPSLRMVMIGSGLAAFVSYGMLNWIPAFLMRTQKMPLEAMATWFAPALVFLHDMQPIPAMKASFAAGVKNWLPMLVFGLILAVALFFATLPAGLGFLLLVPVFAGAVYASYRDIFLDV